MEPPSCTLRALSWHILVMANSAVRERERERDIYIHIYIHALFLLFTRLLP